MSQYLFVIHTQYGPKDAEPKETLIRFPIFIGTEQEFDDACELGKLTEKFREYGTLVGPSYMKAQILAFEMRDGIPLEYRAKVVRKDLNVDTSEKNHVRYLKPWNPWVRTA